jgi:MauM/NapG family ferredoxin protein
LSKTYAQVRLLRAGSQALFFLLFAYLLLATRRGEGDAIGAVERFFHFDPLLALTTSVASRAFFAAFAFSAITVVVSALFGRHVCGWVCPLGSVHHAFSALFAKGQRTRPSREGGPRLAWKYAILVFVLVGSVFTLDLAGYLDPLSFLYRSFTTAVLPAATLAAGAGAAALTDGGLTSLGASSARLVKDLAVNTTFRQGLLIGAMFLAAVALNAVRKRFWCRYLCPAGALLGVIGRWNLVKLRIDADKCNGCNLCTRSCQSQASPYPNERWKAAECFYCYTCATVCPNEAIGPTITMAPARGPAIDLSRRGLVLTSVLGLASVPLFAISASERNSEKLIRPPGALPEPEFLATCVKCGECLKVCPTNGLQHAFDEGGFLAIWTPILVPRIGYCEYQCSLCSQVCPTGAIEQLTIKQKTETKIGSAWIRRHRCIPYATGEPCKVCQERCPTSPKAIQMIETEVIAPDGEFVLQNVPVVDNDICNGCGVCETKCPVVDEPGIYCTSAGESRSDDKALVFRPIV